MACPRRAPPKAPAAAPVWPFEPQPYVARLKINNITTNKLVFFILYILPLKIFCKKNFR
jgi:hypothetical protein